LGLENFKNRKIILLDSAGLEKPILKQDNNNSFNEEIQEGKISLNRKIIL
jgi:hypothetical protein